MAAIAAKLGDLQLAEDAVQDACLAAVAQWPMQGVPDNPTAWLVSVAKRKAIDRVRREAVRGDKEREAAEDLSRMPSSSDLLTEVDDQLALIFACCHPSLDASVQIALTLRSVCGLSTTEIAAAFLLPEPTLAKRLVRGKRKILEAGIRFKVPEPEDLPSRLDSVLRTIYLIFTEGHYATQHAELIRPALCDEAIRLSRELAKLLPEEPEVTGLLALLLLTDSRRAARLTDLGELVTLEEQDRDRWDRSEIREGITLLERASAHGRPGPYQLWAAIAALHAEARRAADTDWPQILRLYDELLRCEPTDVVRANRAVAVAMAQGPADGLAALDGMVNPQVEAWPQFHVARAELLRRLGHRDDAAAAYREALMRERQITARARIEQRLATLV